MKQQLTINFTHELEASFDYFYQQGNEMLLANLQEFVTANVNVHSQQLMYIHGPKGSGKTHLLQATCHYADLNKQNAQYLPCSQLIAMPVAFTHGLEMNHLLLIDDIQEIAADDEWQTSIFDLINRTLEQGHKIVFSGSLPADDIPFTLPDLVSRLNWGQKWLVKPLDEAQRKEMLIMRSQSRGMPMTEELANFIVMRSQQDNASIMRCLEILDTQSLAEKRKLTIPFVKSVMAW
ncbi:DnaA regulatory inactivator Hda [Catenovulum sediminis]|uniref:DnaA regulatory inactivator Hda n=1 Tax=Catenovulum sediminis TaxID=1740262 RepID=A0ABV1RI02_9ALTE|nr:DnaA regulatory inactivator Hda [Catenovulum sediminis]